MRLVKDSDLLGQCAPFASTDLPGGPWARNAVSTCDWHEQRTGGENPNPGPWQREPDIEETRALLWNTTALASGSQRRKAREGRFGRSHRCMTVLSESEAP
jgi:hypothetical protein